MSDPIKEFQALSELAEKHKLQRTKISGAMEQIVNSLKSKGISSIKEATITLNKKKTEKEKKEKDLQQRIIKFKNKYGKYLKDTK